VTSSDSNPNVTGPSQAVWIVDLSPPVTAVIAGVVGSSGVKTRTDFGGAEARAAAGALMRSTSAANSDKRKRKPRVNTHRRAGSIVSAKEDDVF
jgi:hypothetical protein